MKQVSLQVLTFLLVAFTLQTTYAQVTITQETFPRESAFTDSIYKAVPINIASPTFGADQVWDYSSLEAESLYTNEHFASGDDPNFPNAQSYFQNDLEFQGFPISSITYEGLDADGWFDVGRAITDVTYPITTITGGPNDVLRFIGENTVYDGRINTLDFPVTYESQWSQSRIEHTNFELSVAAFGLSGTPGARERVLTHNREIVGYGSLIIPDENGNPTPAMDALLLRIERIGVDSIFLGGAPAPAALLAAFGLVQGGGESDLFYAFYTPNFGAPVLNVNLDENMNPISAFYRPNAADMSTGINELNQYAVNYFPNPVPKGQVLNIQTEFQTYAGDIYIYNLNGELVQKTQYSSASGHDIQLRVPTNINAGLFTYALYDQSGVGIGNGKIVVSQD